MKRRLLYGVAALVVAGAAFMPWVEGIAVTEPRGNPVLLLPLRPGETFTIRFIHSIDGLPVEDTYRLGPTGLVQTQTRLLSFGAGMGHIEGDGTAEWDGPWTVITGMARPIGTLRLRVGSPAVDHTLLWRDFSWRLSPRFAGQLLIIAPARLRGADVLRTLWEVHTRAGKEAA